MSSAYQPRAVGLLAVPPETAGVVGVAEVSGVLVAVPDEGAGVLVPGVPAGAQRLQPYRAGPPGREPGERRGGDADRRVGGVRRQLHPHRVGEHRADRDRRHGEEQGPPAGTLPGPHAGHDQRDHAGEHGHGGDELQHPVRDDLVVHRGGGPGLAEARAVQRVGGQHHRADHGHRAEREPRREPGAHALGGELSHRPDECQRRDQLRAELNGAEGSLIEPVVVTARLRAERHRQPGRRKQQCDRGHSGCANTPARQ